MSFEPATEQSALVLIVDDYADSRAMWAEYLSFIGFRVAEAENGYEALERAQTLLPDIILMDLSLPGIDGWEVTRRLKADNRTRQIPILAVTAHAFSKEVEAAREAGCDGFVTKPCLPDVLAAEIRKVLSRSG